MKSKPTLFLLALPLGAALAADKINPPSAPASQVARSERVTPGSILAAQIQEIVETRDLSDEAKSRQIAAAIRLALNTALKNITDPQQAVRVVLELSQAAAKAAPRFADLIFRTVTTTAREIPVLAGQTGLAETIRNVVADAARAGSDDSEAAGTDRDRRGRDRAFCRLHQRRCRHTDKDEKKEKRPEAVTAFHTEERGRTGNINATD